MSHDIVVQCACIAAGCSTDEFKTKQQAHNAPKARMMVCWYLARQGVDYGDIMNVIGLTRSMVSLNVHKFSILKNSPFVGHMYDRFMDELENHKNNKTKWKR